MITEPIRPFAALEGFHEKRKERVMIFFIKSLIWIEHFGEKLREKCKFLFLIGSFPLSANLTIKGEIW